MKKVSFKTMTTILVVGLLFGTIASSCTSGNKAGDVPAVTDTGGEKKAATDTGGKKEERVKLSMNMTNDGIAIPDGTNLNDNPFINIVKDKANVDLEVEIPPYADYETKYNLLLASGKLPDIVHTSIDDESYKAARDGAFIDLKKYYDNSPIVQKVVTPQMMELARDPISGKYWRIPMAYDKGAQGQGIYARYDLVEKYNAGKWPETVEEWVDLLRKIKKAEPNSIPMSTRIVGDQLFAYGGAVFFNLYGAYPYNYRIQGGKFIPNVVLPEYKAAVQLYRQLYSEGIFDKEFATSTGKEWFPKWNTKDVLFQWNGADQLLEASASLIANKDTPPDQKTHKYAYAPDLKTYPSVLSDTKYAKGFLRSPINTHGLYISSQSKNPDRAWRVIEAFASDELKEAVFWGKAGETYTVKDSKRIPIAEKLGDKSRTYGLMYALLFGYTDGQDAHNGVYEQQMGTDYFNLAKNSMKQLQSDAEANGLSFGNLQGYTEPEDVSKKNSEIMQAINKFTTEAIMGKISMDQFDQAVKDWEKKYRSLKYDPMQKFFDANKDNLSKIGIKWVNW